MHGLDAEFPDVAESSKGLLPAGVSQRKQSLKRFN